MKHRITALLFVAIFAVVGVVSLVAPVVDAADEKKTDDKSKSSSSLVSTGAASLQAYGASAPIQDGTIVQLKDSKKNLVAISDKPDQAHMYGVTVDRNKLSVTISTGAANEVYVATSGTFDVLVSDQGGNIKTGDYVTLSALNGIAMKADGNAATVFGRAGASYSHNDGFGKATLKDSAGKEAQQVTIGMIPVSIEVRANPIKKSTKANVPKFLEKVGEAIAEKQVSAVRIYIGLFITGASIISAIIILYSGVRNSLISIGRNPLSKKSIFRAMAEVILTAVLILIIGLFAVYLLLRL